MTLLSALGAFPSKVACCTLVLALLLPGMSIAEPAAGNISVVYRAESAYYSIQVKDQGSYRHLFLGKQIQSSMDMANPDVIRYPYAQVMLGALAFTERPMDVLCIGLGGGTIPKAIEQHFPAIRLDIVELDPVVADVADEYFDYRPGPRTTLATEDGRLFLRKTAKRYDAILLDAYYGDFVPFHLTTREFLEMMKARLNPGGVVAAHIWGHEINEYYYAQARTYQEVFGEIYLFALGQSGSVVLFAMPQQGPVAREVLVERARSLQQEGRLHFDLAAILADNYSHDTATRIDSLVLTDDYAPVNILQSRTYERD